MSHNRDIPVDQKTTNSVLAADVSIDDGIVNWLGHDACSGAAMIDRMLIGGATRKALETARGAVDEHLRHLKIEHGLKVAELNGYLMFDRDAMLQPQHTKSKPR